MGNDTDGKQFQLLSYDVANVSDAPRVVAAGLDCSEIWGLCVLPNGKDVVVGAWDRVLRVNLLTGESYLLLQEEEHSNANFLLPTVLPQVT